MAYDYTTALMNLGSKIQQLSSEKQQQGQPSSLNTGLRFLRQNKSSLFLIFTMYAMSTASVVSAIMAESRLQSDILLDSHEQRQLKQTIHRLEQQVQGQQQLLDSLRARVQQHSSSWWRGTGPIRQKLLQQLQQWQAGDAPQAAQAASGEQRHGKAADSSQAPQEGQEFGVRVGRLGRGFII